MIVSLLLVVFHPTENDTVNWEFLRRFYFHETSHMLSFVNINPPEMAISVSHLLI